MPPASYRQLLDDHHDDHDDDVHDDDQWKERQCILVLCDPEVATPTVYCLIGW